MSAAKGLSPEVGNEGNNMTRERSDFVATKLQEVEVGYIVNPLDVY